MTFYSEIKALPLTQSLSASRFSADLFSWQNVNVFIKNKKNLDLNLFGYLKKIDKVNKNGSASIDKTLNDSNVNLTSVSIIEDYLTQDNNISPFSSETQSNQSVTYSDLSNSSSKISNESFNKRQILKQSLIYI